MSLPTSIPWLLYRTPLLVSYRRRVPNIDTNWVFKREQGKQVPRSQSWREKKSFSWTHSRTMESVSQVGGFFIWKASTEHVDSQVFNVAESESAKRFETLGYSESDTQGLSLGCLAGVIPKKETGNTQRRYGYRNQTFCFARANADVGYWDAVTNQSVHRGWCYDLHEFHEESLLLWCHSSQL